VVEGSVVPCIDLESRLYNTFTCSGILQIFECDALRARYARVYGLFLVGSQRGIVHYPLCFERGSHASTYDYDHTGIFVCRYTHASYWTVEISLLAARTRSVNPI
jgi:hypothetical protein